MPAVQPWSAAGTETPTLRLFFSASISDGLFTISTYHLVVNDFSGKAM